MEKIKTHRDLVVYRMAFETAMKIFEISKRFPVEEKYSLTDQVRRSSRSVCANLSEAFRKRRYKAAFIAKLSDCESESAETQVWLDFAFECNYLEKSLYHALYQEYDYIIGKLIVMIRNSDKWTL